MDFKDIQPFPRAGWEVDVQYTDLLACVERAQAHDGLDLSPDFQRGHVWTTEQRIRFVEYQLRGGEGGRHLSFNCPGWVRPVVDYGPYQILDGLQRLTSAMMFMRGELPAFGRPISAFTGRIRHFICFKWRIFELSRRDVLQYYVDMNAGGTPHSSHEIERVRALIAAEQT